jgi:hypothetical protein
MVQIFLNDYNKLGVKMLTDNISELFQKIKTCHGNASLNRIETMLNKPQTWKHDLQKEAKYVIPNLRTCL